MGVSVNMRDKLTVPGPLLAFRTEKALSPGMHAILLRLGHEIDRRGFKADVEDAVWFTLPAVELRGERDDNHWLREWLRRLRAVELEGEYRGTPWGAALIAEWRIEHGGSQVRVLVPPSAINALRAPETFAKVETECLYRLQGAARKLYLALADKKRLGQQHWEFPVSELRGLLGVAESKAYARFNHFRERVLAPAVERVNDFGTVHVTMEPVRAGRMVDAVRFEWRWKTLDEAREAAAEADRPKVARGKPRDMARDAAPLTDPRPGSPEERQAVLDRTGARDYARERA